VSPPPSPVDSGRLRRSWPSPWCTIDVSHDIAASCPGRFGRDDVSRSSMTPTATRVAVFSYDARRSGVPGLPGVAKLLLLPWLWYSSCCYAAMLLSILVHLCGFTLANCCEQFFLMQVPVMLVDLLLCIVVLYLCCLLQWCINSLWCASGYNYKMLYMLF
jgi:hypothetical protein